MITHSNDYQKFPGDILRLCATELDFELGINISVFNLKVGQSEVCKRLAIPPSL
jgi:hypothetical protein